MCCHTTERGRRHGLIEWISNPPKLLPLLLFLSKGQTLFPYETNYWTADNYGPIWIPKKGATIQLNPPNVRRYHRCIDTYEGISLKKKTANILLMISLPPLILSK